MSLCACAQTSWTGAALRFPRADEAPSAAFGLFPPPRGLPIKGGLTERALLTRMSALPRDGGALPPGLRRRSRLSLLLRVTAGGALLGEGPLGPFNGSGSLGLSVVASSPLGSCLSVGRTLLQPALAVGGGGGDEALAVLDTGGSCDGTRPLAESLNPPANLPLPPPPADSARSTASSLASLPSGLLGTSSIGSASALLKGCGGTPRWFPLRSSSVPKAGPSLP